MFLVPYVYPSFSFETPIDKQTLGQYFTPTISSYYLHQWSHTHAPLDKGEKINIVVVIAKGLLNFHRNTVHTEHNHGKEERG